MSKVVDDILTLISNNAPPQSSTHKWVGEAYLGSKRKFLGIPSKERRQLARKWSKDHPDLADDELTSVISRLYKSQIADAVFFASDLLSFYPKHRKELELSQIYEWLGDLNGWAEIDSLCQRSFPANELLSRWPEWKTLLAKLNKDNDIRRRRASLVLLCKSLKESDEPKLAAMAFQNISNTQHEREILITKAVSWLLRELVKYHAKEVVVYLDANTESLPKIALRETKRKLETGRK